MIGPEICKLFPESAMLAWLTSDVMGPSTIIMIELETWSFLEEPFWLKWLPWFSGFYPRSYSCGLVSAHLGAYQAGQAHCGPCYWVLCFSCLRQIGMRKVEVHIPLRTDNEGNAHVASKCSAKKWPCFALQPKLVFADLQHAKD